MADSFTAPSAVSFRDASWLSGTVRRRHKAEADGRIFPASDRAEDVVSALQRYLDDGGVRVRTGARVSALQIKKQRVKA